LTAEHAARKRPPALLALFALGVVYGDIGTSPIYAFRESLLGHAAIGATRANILGLLSLIFWSLAVVISLKYLFYIMRAENEGEGGILALASLLAPWRRGRRLVAFLGVFGAALLYGDGMITPAISVLSAVEGLGVAVPSMTGLVLPLTILILVLLFLFQSRGTTGVGAVFGPVMLVWFAALAALGLRWIIREPGVLAAVSPTYAVAFFASNGFSGFLVLGTIFLVVTGGEAMYADRGHFGAWPIRLGWFAVALPALLLNYFGQGAMLLRAGDAGTTILQPFYQMAPDWALHPLVGLATAATVIASQAVISGVFSLTRQAIQLGQCPRLRVEQTSEEEVGRVYIPSVNWAMMIATIGLVLGFRSSSGLAAAYGVAVSTTFVITTLLAYRVARERWGWSLPLAGAVTAGFLVIDLAFFGANMFKFVAGGWFPLVVAGLVWFLMATWARGDELIEEQLGRDLGSIDELLARIRETPIPRVPGTGVFLTEETKGTPPILRYYLERIPCLHETTVLLTTLNSNVPRVPFADRLEIEELGEGLYRVVAHYGFMQGVHVPVLVEACRRAGVPLADRENTTYYLRLERPVAVEELGMVNWRARLFALMARNVPRPEEVLKIPPRRVIELGMTVEV
jgi:KUP system potassium uptake protein